MRRLSRRRVNYQSYNKIRAWRAPSRGRSSWSPLPSATSRTSRSAPCGCSGKWQWWRRRIPAAAVTSCDTIDIRTPLVSLHEHNELRRRVHLVSRLKAGESVALVSDAGTPGISDPGASFVRAARDAGIRVEPVPGPSAVTATMSVAGVESQGFVFMGFLPTRSKARKIALARLVAFPALSCICFEAPHRLRKTLRELRPILGNHQIFIARELTKIHEQWMEGPLERLEAEIADPRGEFVIIIPPRSVDSAPAGDLTDGEVSALFGQITEKAPPDDGRASENWLVGLVNRRRTFTRPWREPNYTVNNLNIAGALLLTAVLTRENRFCYLTSSSGRLWRSPLDAHRDLQPSRRDRPSCHRYRIPNETTPRMWRHSHFSSRPCACSNSISSPRPLNCSVT